MSFPKMAIRVNNLSKRYRKYQAGESWGSILKAFLYRKYAETTAVDSVSFEIPAGTCVGLLGANGAGKTTLIKMLSGLLVQSSGEASVLGYRPWERHHDYLRKIGVVMGQKQQLWIDVSSYENFRLNKIVYQISQKDFDERIAYLSALLDVKNLLHVQVRKLSLGEKMKMELLAAFLHKPKLLFLDEPTIGLDIVAQTKIREFIKTRIQEDGLTVLLTSHYMRDLEELCPRVLLIQNGKLIHDGSLSDLAGTLGEVKRVVWLERHKTSTIGKPLGDGRFFIEAPTKDIASIVRSLLQSSGVEDLNIESPALEESVRAIFTSKGPV